MKLLLAGATGLTGSRLLPMLLAGGHEVAAVGRRPTGLVNARLTEVMADFSTPPSLPPAEVAICTLGTTIAKAGSQQAFRAVDHDAVLHFAREARTAGCRQFVLMTAVGAAPDAAAFYSRVKGEVEAAVRTLGFERVDLIRPGLILGPRAERRPMEALFQRLAPVLNPLLGGRLARYGAIEVDSIAVAIARLVGEARGGVFIHENPALRQLAQSGPPMSQ
jgi:uncharacterized protein YbjT (DUF2867 family)